MKIRKMVMIFLLLIPLVFAFDLSYYPDYFIFNRSVDAILVIGDNSLDEGAALNIISGLKLSEFYSDEISTDDAKVMSFASKNPLKRSKDLKSLYEKNIIIVGGPCANPFAARIMNRPSKWPECAEGFKQDFAIVKLYNNYDKYQLLVAGYEAKDTLSASKMFINFTKYDFVGKKMEINTYNVDNPKIHGVIYE